MKETTFFRIQEEMKEYLNELTTIDQEIRVLGDNTSARFIQFITQDVMGNLRGRIDDALDLLEEKFESEFDRSVKPTKGITTALLILTISYSPLT